jgi:hypothetical protein
MVLILLFLWMHLQGDQSHQAIVHRKGQTPQVAKEARPQCETNHIVVAMAALTCSRNDNQNASRAIVTARLFPPQHAHASRSIVAIAPNLQAVDALLPRFDNAHCVS